MRVFVAVAHYFDEAGGGGYASLGGQRTTRVDAVRSCLSTLIANFGHRQIACEYSDRPTPVPANVPNVSSDGNSGTNEQIGLRPTSVDPRSKHQLEIASRNNESEWAETSSRDSNEIEIVVCTTDGKHLLEDVGIDLAAVGVDKSQVPLRHSERTCDARYLGFECHQALKEAHDKFDVYAYLEDDLILRDATFFEKILYFQQQFGPTAVLQPNRFEILRGSEPSKVYIDVRTPSKVGEQAGYAHNFCDDTGLSFEHLGRSVKFERATNPHSGCFFLSREQMNHWKSQPYFGKRSDRFFGPLESAATLHLMKTFRVYRPALVNANFLEVEHYGDAWAHKLPAFRLGAR